MSETKLVKLDEASALELRAFAESHLGMTFKGNESKENMRAAIRPAWNKDEIPVPDEAPTDPVQGAAPKPATASQQPPKEKVRVLIATTEGQGGDEAVPLGVNGKIMLVPRGKEVDIPAEYFEVLKNAVRHVREPLKDAYGNMAGLGEPREVPAYPFQRIA